MRIRKLAIAAENIVARASYTMRRLLAKEFRLSVLACACCKNEVLVDAENMHSGIDGFCSAEPEAVVKLRMVW